MVLIHSHDSMEIHYKGPIGVRSRCYLDIYNVDGTYYVIFTEPPEGKESGTSVTNAIEELIHKVRTETLKNVAARDMRFFERYNYPRQLVFDEVFVDGYGCNPHWKPSHQYPWE